MISKLVLAGALLPALLLLGQGEVPRPSPDFTVNLPGGQALTVQSLKGKIVVLAFISTTCPHCQALTGELTALQKEYAGKGVQVVECAFNDGVTEADAMNFSTQFHPGFPIGMNHRPAVYAYLQFSSVRILYVPHVVVIDRTGVIRGDYPGGSPFLQNAAANLRTELNQMLGAAARK